jgi:hypothetical protein
MASPNRQSKANRGANQRIKSANTHHMRQLSPSHGRIVGLKKGDCASEELSHLPMYIGVDLYNIQLVPVRDFVYIPAKIFVLGDWIPRV